MAKSYTNPIYPYRRSSDQDAQQPVHHPVIIIGGGPTGLYSALDFAKQGIATVVLDNDNTVSNGSRALCFAKRTLEIFDRVDCGQRMVDKGVTWQLGKVFFHDQLTYEFNLLPESGHERPAFINIQQYYPEEYLVDQIAKTPSIDLRWMNKVTQVKKIGDKVEVLIETPEGEYTLTADYVLVADGANSPIRTSLGLESKGQIFEDTFLIADIVMEADFPPERWFWFDPPFHPGQSVLLHKQPDGLWRIDFQLGANASREYWLQHDNIRPLIHAMLGQNVQFEFEWVSVYHFRCRRLEQLIHDERIIFVGDSAHQVSPFGARGANGAVQAAENLVWKLTRILKGTAPKALLSTYHTERSHGADENILNSTRATDFISPKNHVTRVFRDAVLNLAQQYEFTRPMINSGRLSKPCVYDGSALNTPDEEGSNFPHDQRVGSVCKDASITINGQKAWWLRQLGDHFTVAIGVGEALAKNADLQAKIQQLQALPDVKVLLIDAPSMGQAQGIQDSEGVLHERLGLQPETTYLIRPDQHIAARWRQLDIDKVQQAMRRALGFELAEGV